MIPPTAITYTDYDNHPPHHALPIWTDIRTLRRPQGLGQAIEGKEGQAGCVYEVPHAVHVQLVREQLGSFRRIDTVKAAMPGRWAGDPHVDLARTCVTHHLHDLQRDRKSTRLNSSH